MFPFAKEIKTNAFNWETTAEGNNTLLAAFFQKPRTISWL